MRADRLFASHRTLSVATLSAMLSVGSIDIARAANVVSRLIENAQPCSGLKTKKIGQTIGIDKFKSADLETLKVDVAGNDAKLTLVGSLACRTSDQAVFDGDASAKFSGAAELDLAACTTKQVSVRILSTGGTYGFVVDTFKDKIQTAVEAAISQQIKALCK